MVRGGAGATAQVNSTGNEKGLESPTEEDGCREQEVSSKRVMQRGRKTGRHSGEGSKEKSGAPMFRDSEA